MVDSIKQPGRLRPAPESFLGEAQIKAVGAGRRDFLRKSLLAAGAALATPLAARAAEGDPNILQNPEWTTTLGNPVAMRPYGSPSKYESQVIRRESPGLARVVRITAQISNAGHDGWRRSKIYSPHPAVAGSRIPLGWREP